MMSRIGTLMKYLTFFVFVCVIPSQSTSVNFFRLGCFQDHPTRAMPEELGVWRLDSNVIQKCAQATKSAGYSVFGVQDGGQCWSGPLAHLTYKKYGTSTRCVNGIGGNWAQDVYRIVDASLTGKYDVKRCYEVDVTFHYRIEGGLTSGTISSTKSTFSSIFSGVFGILSSQSACIGGVAVSQKDILNSPPGVESVYFRIPLIFTASTSVPDDEVSQNLTNCISTLYNYKHILDSNTPKIVQGGMNHSAYNLSTISNKTSCCGGDIPPPCCAVGSIQINSTKCACLAGFHFVPGSLCQRCPSDTYQDEQGQSSCKKCPEGKQTFGKTGTTSNSSCSDPPLIGNYDVKRCFELDSIFHYQIPGGLTMNTIRYITEEFYSFFLILYNPYLSIQQCSEVSLTIGNITSSPPGVSNVYFRVPFTYTASNDIADDQVASNVTTCINAANFTLKGYIDRNAPNITQNNGTHQINQPSFLEKRSCCGGDIPPPCCTVGSNRVSSTKCGCLPGFHFVTDRSCLPCPADTYQDEQGQTSCKTCPVNTGTFGKTGMTNHANCTGCAPGFRFAPGFNSSCLRCPSDTYQEEKGQKECKKCPGEKRTFNKTGMSRESHCLDANPLQIHDQVVFLPENINNETVAVNVTVNTVLSSLVRPFVFNIDGVTQPLQSRVDLGRKRRSFGMDSPCIQLGPCPQFLVDPCLKAGAVKPENYFCIHQCTGRIRVTQDFFFKEGELFDLQIRVTDSDHRGITENMASIRIISGDPCKNIQEIYDEAVKYCIKIKNSESVDEEKWCMTKQCTEAAHNWKEALNNASQVPEKNCSADPHHLATVMREHPRCEKALYDEKATTTKVTGVDSQKQEEKYVVYGID